MATQSLSASSSPELWSDRTICPSLRGTFVLPRRSPVLHHRSPWTTWESTGRMRQGSLLPLEERGPCSGLTTLGPGIINIPQESFIKEALGPPLLGPSPQPWPSKTCAPDPQEALPASPPRLCHCLHHRQMPTSGRESLRGGSTGVRGEAKQFSDPTPNSTRAGASHITITASIFSILWLGRPLSWQVHLLASLWMVCHGSEVPHQSGSSCNSDPWELGNILQR